MPLHEHPVNVAIIFAELLHYHVARYRALANAAAAAGDRVTLLAMRPADPALPLGGYHDLLDGAVTVVLPADEADLNSRAARRRLWATLDARRPDAILIPGYSDGYTRTMLRWCHLRRSGAVLMSESREADFARAPWREWLKRTLVQQFDAALVGGAPHERYARRLGIASDAIAPGYDAVDNDFWQRESDAARADVAGWQARLGLPRPFFIAVSRFVEKKNLPGLLDGYARYRALATDPWDLVLAGAGPLGESLRAQVAALGLADRVHFPGYLSASALVPYYALAGAFVHASDRSEQWGLVVNEAMAAALPVLVSETVGCVEDLVIEGETGYTFVPTDPLAIATALARVVALPEAARRAMGARGRARVAHFAPAIFAATALRLARLAAARAQRRPPLPWHPLLWL